MKFEKGEIVVLKKNPHKYAEFKYGEQYKVYDLHTYGEFEVAEHNEFGDEDDFEKVLTREDVNIGDTIKFMKNTSEYIGYLSENVILDLKDDDDGKGDCAKLIKKDGSTSWYYLKNFILVKKAEKKVNNVKNNDKKGEDVKMNLNVNKYFGEIGQIKDGSVALTMNGNVAFKKEDGDYVRYNEETGTLENQMDLVIKEMSEMIMVMPTQEVVKGDIIKSNSKYYQVLEVLENGSISVVDLNKGTTETKLKETNIFGMNFYSKVTNIMQQGEGNTFNPMMLMLLGDKKEGKSDDMLEMMLMSQMFNADNKNNNAFNPMMLMMMKGDMDVTKLMLMSQMGGFDMFGQAKK